MTSVPPRAKSTPIEDNSSQKNVDTKAPSPHPHPHPHPPSPAAPPASSPAAPPDTENEPSSRCPFAIGFDVFLHVERKVRELQLPSLIQFCIDKDFGRTYPSLNDEAILLDTYIAAAGKLGSTSVGNLHFYGKIWKDFETGSYIITILTSVPQVWPDRPVSFHQRMSDALIDFIQEMKKKQVD